MRPVVKLVQRHPMVGAAFAGARAVAAAELFKATGELPPDAQTTANAQRRGLPRGYMTFGGRRHHDTAELLLALDAAQRVYDAALDDALAARRRPLVP